MGALAFAEMIRSNGSSKQNAIIAPRTAAQVSSVKPTKYVSIRVSIVTRVSFVALPVQRRLLIPLSIDDEFMVAHNSDVATSP